MCTHDLSLLYCTKLIIRLIILKTKQIMDSPLIKSKKRSYENESPRQQRTCAKKKEIIDFYNSIKDKYGSKSLTVKTFGISNVSALNRILEKEESINELLDDNKLDMSRKRLRLGKYELLDANLYNFMVNVRHNNGEISCNDLKIKSLELASQLNINDFKASDGYIQKWKMRHNIKFKTLSGEGGSVEETVVDDWFLRLAETLKEYDSRYVYNLDETGLFWKTGKGKSYVLGIEAANKDLRGIKMSKDRVTLLVGGSMAGEKLPLLVIGKSKKPRCFNGVIDSCKKVQWIWGLFIRLSVIIKTKCHLKKIMLLKTKFNSSLIY